jgi:hypothetical protein
VASLYDEKALGAKQQMEFARKLRESAAQPQGQMVSGWYVAPSWTQHLQGVAQNILGAYQEKDARNELKDIERQKLADTIRGMNDMGIEAPADMVQRAGTPEQEPSLWDKGKAFVTGEDQPQAVPAQPLAQNVSKEPNKNALLSLMLRSPDMASGIIAMQKAQKENNPDPYFQPPVAATVGGKPMFIRQNARNGEISPVQIDGQDVVPAGYDVPLVAQKKSAEEGAAIVPVENQQGQTQYFKKGDIVSGSNKNIANNNFGNIRPVGSDTGFQAYSTPEEGVGALSKQISIYKTKHGLNTIAEIGNRYAPPSENDTATWIKNVSKFAGIDPNQPIDASDTETNKRLTLAIAQQENGAKSADTVAKVFGQPPQQKIQNEVEKQRLIEALKPKKEPALTEAQSNAYLYSKRMGVANDTLEKNKDYSSTVLNASKALDGIPLVGTIAHSLLGNKEQKVSQAQRDFVSAVLRKESGAAIGKSEFENASKQYFPQVGDSPDVVAQKAANRKTAVEAIEASVPQEFLQKQQPAMQMPPMDAIQAEITRRKAARGQ